MGGFFGTISKKNCVADLFYGTDYNSHLGTRRAGMATYSEEKGMVRSIHNIEGSYFRSKFEDGLHKFNKLFLKFAQQRMNLARAHGKGHVVQNGVFTIALGDIFHFQNKFCAQSSEPP